MELETVLYDVTDGVATLTLNRPERANTIDARLIEDLHTALDAIQRDAAVRVAIVTGAGRHFCGGADLRSSAPSTGGRGGPNAAGQELFSRFEEIPQPVIAAINGPAMGGGCELALACDFRIMAEGATIGVPEILFGSLPAGGGTQRLPRLIGTARARDLIYTGRHVTAVEGLSFGLVHKIVPPTELLSEARSLAESLIQRPAYALAAAKWLVTRALDVDVRTGLLLERQVIATMGTPAERAHARRQAAVSSGVYGRIFRGSGSSYAGAAMAAENPTGEVIGERAGDVC